MLCFVDARIDAFVRRLGGGCRLDDGSEEAVAWLVVVVVVVTASRSLSLFSRLHERGRLISSNDSRDRA
jgi:hypothetical protein